MKNKTAYVLIDDDGVIVGIIHKNKSKKEFNKNVVQAIGNSFSATGISGKILKEQSFVMEYWVDNGAIQYQAREFSLTQTTIYQ